MGKKCQQVNPQTNKQSHTPTMVQGGGVDGTPPPPPWVFIMLQYFEKISLLVESLWCAVQGEVHILGCRTAGGLWRHSKWPPYWALSWILLKIRNCQKTCRIWHVEYCMTLLNILLLFVDILCIIHLKRVKKEHEKMAWPPATYDVIFHNYSNWFSPTLCQNVS